MRGSDFRGAPGASGGSAGSACMERRPAGLGWTTLQRELVLSGGQRKPCPETTADKDRRRRQGRRRRVKTLMAVKWCRREIFCARFERQGVVVVGFGSSELLVGSG